MKIINVLFSDKLGGMEQAFIDYSKSLMLSSSKNEILAITKPDAPYIESLQNLNVSVLTIENNLGYIDYPAIWKLREIVKKEKPDIVIAHSGRAISLMKRAVKNICPIVGVNHSYNVKRSIGCDAVFAINSYMLDEIIKAGQSEDSAFLIPNMIDLNGEDEADINDTAPSNIIGNSLITIGVLGRFVKAKGFDHFIRAIKILTSRGIDVRAIVAGKGEEEDALKEIVDELKINDRVFFPGWITNKEWLFNSMDIFCLPSISEPFGIVVLEAMCFEKAIVATDCHGPRDILENGKDSIMVSREDLEDLPIKLADAFERLINDRKLRNTLAKNAFKKVKEKYNMKVSGKRIQSILQGIVKKNKKE